jgi:hypothetical protein
VCDGISGIELDRLAEITLQAHPVPVVTEAAGALREAATLTREATLKNFLTLRAQALLDDD